jgi:hypothetical protein
MKKSTRKIYHYTSTEALALILKTKKLRFTRLDGVDDLKEAQKRYKTKHNLPHN